MKQFRVYGAILTFAPLLNMICPSQNDLIFWQFQLNCTKWMTSNSHWSSLWVSYKRLLEGRRESSQDVNTTKMRRCICANMQPCPFSENWRISCWFQRSGISVLKDRPENRARRLTFRSGCSGKVRYVGSMYIGDDPTRF